MIIEGVLDCALQISTLDRLMLEALDKCGRPRDETGRTIAALERKFFDESFLNRRQFRDIALCVRFCLAFDSDDCLAVEIMGIGNTGPGVDQPPVRLHFEDGAGMADTLPTAEMCAGQVEIVM